jgi:F0F1-type ATP synthase delta subunit
MKLPTPTREDLRQLARVRRGESVSKPGAFLKAVRAEVVRRTTPDDASLARDFLSRSGTADVVTVQVAVEPDAKTGDAIAKAVSSEPDTLVRVRIERGLLGGLRLFRHGTLHDASWRSKIRSVLSAITRHP